MKIRVYAALLGAILWGWSIAPNPVRAIETASDEKISVPAEKVIADDFAAAGTEIHIAGRIEGSLFAAGQNIAVPGAVTLTVHAVGSELTLTGPIGDDLWAVGGTVKVKSKIAHNVGLAGSTVTLEPEAIVGRDASVAGSAATVQGAIGRNLSLYAGTATLNAPVGGNVEAHANLVTLGPKAVVEGDLTVYAPNQPTLEPGAIVKGKINYYPTTNAPPPTPMQRFRSWMAGWMYHFGATLILGFALLALFSAPLARITEVIRQRPGTAFLVGSLALIGVPVAAVLMTVTLIGFPLAVTVTALYMVALLAANAVMAAFLGDEVTKVLNRPMASRWARFTIGALLVALIASVPYVGGLAEGIFVALGSGALYVYCRDRIAGSSQV